MGLRTNWVLVDFESVQPESLALLQEEHFRLMVFVGANQHKLGFQIADAVQQMGERAKYVKITGNGPNALDFHIAFYIGQISAVDPSTYFHIVSKDTGFDPLIAHLKERKVFVAREASISDIGLLKAGQAKTSDERLDAVLVKLKQLKASKPRTVKTLASTVAALFQKQLLETEVATLVETLQSKGIVTVTGTKLSYKLADEV